MELEVVTYDEAPRFGEELAERPAEIRIGRLVAATTVVRPTGSPGGISPAAHEVVRRMLDREAK